MLLNLKYWQVKNYHFKNQQSIIFWSNYSHEQLCHDFLDQACKKENIIFSWSPDSFVCQTDLYQPVLRKFCTSLVLWKTEETSGEKNRSPDIRGNYNLTSNQDKSQFWIFALLSINSEYFLPNSGIHAIKTTSSQLTWCFHEQELQHTHTSVTRSTLTVPRQEVNEKNWVRVNLEQLKFSITHQITSS